MVLCLSHKLQNWPFFTVKVVTVSIASPFSLSLSSQLALCTLPCSKVLFLQLVVYSASAKLVLCLLAKMVGLSTCVFPCTDLLTEQELWNNLKELL